MYNNRTEIYSDDFGLASDEVPQGYQEQKAIHFCLTCDVEPEQ